MPTRNLPPSERAERVRVGATVRLLREMRGFKQEEFAKEIEISRPYLVNIERGRKPVTEVLLARMSRVLQVRPVAIIREDYFEDVAF